MTIQSSQTGLPCGNATEGRAAHGFDLTDGVRDRRALESCTICDTKAGMRCPLCGTWYCNQECLRKDWVHHKTLCKSLKDEFNGDKAPLNNVRAILFPMDAKKPSWVWINLRTLDMSIIRALGITMPKPLKKDVNQLAIKDINKSLRHREIGHGIRQFTAPKARFESPEGHNINKSIFALADPGSLKTYFGSALFFGFRTSQSNGDTKIYYEDASPRDLRMIIEWYYTRPGNPFVSERHRLPIEAYGYPGEEVRLWPAVKINCKVDIDRLSQLSGEEIGIIQPVQVLSVDFFQCRTEVELAVKAGLPWVVQPCHDTFDPVTDRGHEVSLLNNECGPAYAPPTKNRFQPWRLDNPEGWVLPAHLPAKYFGSLLVMRKDGRDMYAAYAVSFSHFVTSRLQDAGTHIIYKSQEEGVGRALIHTAEIDRIFTRKDFEAHWREENGGTVALLYPSPYDDADEVELSLALEEEEEAYDETEEVVYPLPTK